MHRLTPHLGAKKHVLWDWNGTLLDDVDLCVDVIGAMTARHGLPAPDRERYLRVFRFPVIEYYKDLGFDFERVSFATLSDEFHRAYLPRARHAPLFSGTRELLTDLGRRGVTCSVLSATREPDLHAMLAHHGVDRFFQHIYGIGDQYAVSKVERGRQLMKALAAAPDDAVLIGDTDHDLEVGAALGIDVILVDGGHQHHEHLERRAGRVVRRTGG